MLSNRVHYVLDGTGEFIIDDEVLQGKATDMVIVPKNTPYDYQATNNSTLKLFLVHPPAFDQKYEVELEAKPTWLIPSSKSF